MTKNDGSFVGQKIKVICRIRPILNKEVEEPVVVQVKDDTTIALDDMKSNRPRLHKNFSSCYSSDASQNSIFIKDVQPLIERVFEGFDTSIFAYGVTGSGKTFTMQGDQYSPGIIPRAAGLLFETKQATLISTIEITMSYMEILKDKVHDLLISKGKRQNLDIRQDITGNVFVSDLEEVKIQSYQEFETLFSNASKTRSTGSTDLNQTSSRSHAILTFKVKTVTPVEAEDGLHNETVTGKIDLIDLAGSEDNRKSGNRNERMKESSAINLSLTVLGKVIEALNTGMSRVPYRDSKMTRILQSTLSGNSLGMMIVNIAPGYNFINDTIKTLSFASRLKEVKKRAPKANVRVTRSSTKAKLNDTLSHQTTSTRTTRATRTTIGAHLSPDRDANLDRSRHHLTADNSRRLTTTYQNKRPLNTYEQRPKTFEQLHRIVKRSRYSLAPNDATTILPQYSSQSQSLSPPSPISKIQRGWSTITVSDQHHIPLEDAMIPKNTSGLADSGDEMIVLSKSELNDLIQRAVRQTREDILSRIHGQG